MEVPRKCPEIGLPKKKAGLPVSWGHHVGKYEFLALYELWTSKNIYLCYGERGWVL